ncbi:MAG TPA: hypothetical protein VFB12_10740 [Ktedonobacteraceae bacterium]|nr:hypothetical protein [Ktedonobacteraceae bacterium]
MKYVRMYADKNGDSHFEDVEVEMSLVDFSPPTPPMGVSSSMPSMNVVFASTPVGWYGEPHPVPGRFLIIYLAGEMEVTVSDGELRRFGPDSVVLVEDTSGKGHASRAISNDNVLAVMVQLTD